MAQVCYVSRRSVSSCARGGKRFANHALPRNSPIRGYDDCLLEEMRGEMNHQLVSIASQQ